MRSLLGIYRKLIELLDSRERRVAGLLVLLMIVVALVELVGVASIFPLIAVISDPSTIQTNSLLNMVYVWFGFTEINPFLALLSAVVFALVVARTALAGISNFVIMRFSYARGHSLSARLLRAYLSRSYSWFLTRHSADLTRALFSEVDEVVGGALMPGLQLVAQGITAILLILLVFVADPVVAMVATAVLIVSYSAVYLLIRDTVRKIGEARLAANSSRFRIAQEVLGGVKAVKVAGQEYAYVHRFDLASLQFARQRARLQILGEAPRYALEAIAIGGMLLVVFGLLVRNESNINAALPTIALYAFAGLRLLPVIQTLYKSVVLLRMSGPAIDRMMADLSAGEVRQCLTPATMPMSFTSKLSLESVSFAYEGAATESVVGVKLAILANSSLAFIGRTGAGKSTIIDLVLGLLEPTAGQITVDGVRLSPENVRSWQRLIGYVPQHIFLADESIASNIAFGVPNAQIDMSAVERAARVACLHDFVTGSLPDGYNTLVGERGVRLSGGQRQRLGIARALYSQPSVLILDEATSALDNATERQVMSSIRTMKCTVIAVAHRLSTIADFDNIVVMRDGLVVQSGTWSKLVAEGGEFKQILH